MSSPLYQLEYTRAAEKEIRKLSRPLQAFVLDKLEQLSYNPRPHGMKKLSGYKDYYRIRIGDYRAVYSIKDRELFVLVVRFAPRKDAYRKL